MKKLMLAIIAALPIVSIATAVSAHAIGNSNFGWHQPECPKELLK